MDRWLLLIFIKKIWVFFMVTKESRRWFHIVLPRGLASVFLLLLHSINSSINSSLCLLNKQFIAVSGVMLTGVYQYLIRSNFEILVHLVVGFLFLFVWTVHWCYIVLCTSSTFKRSKFTAEELAVVGGSNCSYCLPMSETRSIMYFLSLLVSLKYNFKHVYVWAKLKMLAKDTTVTR